MKDCNGIEWISVLFFTDTGWLTVWLLNKGNDEIYSDAKCTISIKDANGGTVRKWDIGVGDDFENEGDGIDSEEIMDASNNILKDGALSIDVTVQMKDEEDYLCQPLSHHACNMLRLLKSEEDTDIFLAQKQIIKANAPILANFNGGIIKDTSPEVFQILLEHIYSGCLPT